MQNKPVYPIAKFDFVVKMDIVKNLQLRMSSNFSFGHPEHYLIPGCWKTIFLMACGEG